MLLRKLGDVEQSLDWSSQEALTGNIVTYSRIRGPLTVRQLEEALSICCRRHPLLAAQIVNRRGQLYFATQKQSATQKQPATQEPPTIALEVVRLQAGERWEDRFQHALNQPLVSRDRSCNVCCCAPLIQNCTIF